jgi:transcriptional regulator with XRE-family HTH domain
MNDYKTLITKNNLRSIRKALGLRQQDVSDMLGLQIIDRISHWENGQALPSVLNLFRLCRIYKKTPQELYHDLFTAIDQSSETTNISQIEDDKIC